MRVAVAVGLVVLGLQLATVRGSLGGGQDEEIVFVQTASLIRTGRLRLDRQAMAEIEARTGQWRDAVRPGLGGWYAVYGPTQSLLTIPLYLLGRLAARDQTGESARATLVRWATAFNPLVTALTAALLCGWLLLLGYPRGVGIAGGLGFALATLAWPYSKTYLSEPLSALLILAAALTLWLARERGSFGGALAAGCLLAAAGLTRPHNLILAPVLAGLLLPRELKGSFSPWRAVAFTLPILLIALWWLWYNAQRFGGPLDFGYLGAIQADFAWRNLPRGLVGQLVSPGRGLLWYAPPVVLALWGFGPLRRRDPGLAWVLLGAVVWQWVFYSLRSTWWGNWCWGPRYFVPVLPLLAILAAPALALDSAWLRRLAWALALLGVINALAGLVVYNGLYQDAVFARPDGLRELLWSPRWSPLVGHWRYAAEGYVDLMVWHLARLEPAFGLATGLVRLLPALVGGWLLAVRRADG